MSADTYIAKHSKPSEKPSLTEFKSAIGNFFSKALSAYAETKSEPDN